MKRFMASLLSMILPLSVIVVAQTPQPSPQQQPQQQSEPDEVLRITTDLVQTDVVVTDKNDRIINDLKTEDFELYENGKKQDIKFLEFVSAETGRRIEGKRPAGISPSELPTGALPSTIETDANLGLTASTLKRVVAFVIDDLTIPNEDLYYVRGMLSDFVNNQMHEGDLVAIVRVIGGRGLLQQFTSDRQLLRRAISSITLSSSQFSAFDNPDIQQTGVSLGKPSATTASAETGGSTAPADLVGGGLDTPADINSATDDTQRSQRALISLSTAGYVIDSMKQIPGRKSMVLVSGGLPLFSAASSGSIIGNVSYLVNQLTDNATRAGVAINTLDARGLDSQRGVASFVNTPGRSGLSEEDPSFGRGGGHDEVFGNGAPFSSAEGQIGLRALANATGGVSVQNTNNFKEGLERILARSSGYYVLAYTPSEGFDNKFRKTQIKVRRSGAHVYTHAGYLARTDSNANAPRTKEASIAAAARSPLAKQDVGVSANVSYRMVAANKALLGVNLLIDPKKLNFTQSANGKYQTSLDVVGFVFDQIGKLRGGFSETVNTSLSAEEYKRAQTTGITYSTGTELPNGYYQLRTVVRESGTGNIGTLSKYLEIPNLSNGRLAVSSLFLYAVDSAQSSKTAGEPLLALRQLSRKQDVRYSAIIYNPKFDKSKPRLRSQMIISQGGKVLYREPEQPIEGTANSESQIVKVGQLGLSKVKPGRYVLTLLISDPLANKKDAPISRSIDFTVVN